MNELLDAIGFFGNLLDTPWAAVRTGIARRDPIAGFESIVDFDKRASGREMLESLGMLGENQEGLDWGDVAGAATEIIPDILLPGLGAWKALKYLRGAKAPVAASVDPIAEMMTTGGNVAEAAAPQAARQFADEDVLRWVGPDIAPVQQQPLGVGHKLRLGQEAIQPPPRTETLAIPNMKPPTYVASSLDELMEITDPIQKKADDLIDQHLKDAGVSLRDPPDDVFNSIMERPDVRAAFDERIALEEAFMGGLNDRVKTSAIATLKEMEPHMMGVHRLQENVADVLSAPTEFLKRSPLEEILRDEFSTQNIYMLHEHGKRALANRKKTIDSLARRLYRESANKTGMDADGMLGPMSGLGDDAKDDMLNWFHQAAERLYDSVTSNLVPSVKQASLALK